MSIQWLTSKCLYCSEHHHATRDHLTARSKGGVKRYYNIAIVCAKCNRKKGCMKLSDHIKKESREFFIELIVASRPTCVLKRNPYRSKRILKLVTQRDVRLMQSLRDLHKGHGMAYDSFDVAIMRENNKLQRALKGLV